ncbi:metal-dependent hydrolase [Actinophytocola sp.]|uniref:metal-dependent hydrolase n=1 Tax=Actinophytocola sp. TaxID=1872138 RepID=UPI003D6C41B2
MVRIKYYGHACFALDAGDTSVLIDPWLTGNPEVGHIPDDVRPTLILVTHNHEDHVGDAIELSKRHGAPIVATPHAARHYIAEGAAAIRLHLGGRERFEWGSVKCVPAFHDSPIGTGTTFRLLLGAPCGFVVTIGGKRVYHAGDTCLFGDMDLFAPVDVAMLPMDGKMTMEPADAVRAAKFTQAGLVLPMHARQEDPHAFVKLLAEEGIQGRAMARGETLELT